MDLKLPQDIVESAVVCQNCFIKFNEIDEHQVIAEKIQMELVGLFNSNSAALTEVKEENLDVKDEVAVEEVIQTSNEVVEEFYVGLTLVVIDGQKLYQCDIPNGKNLHVIHNKSIQ